MISGVNSDPKILIFLILMLDAKDDNVDAALDSKLCFLTFRMGFFILAHCTLHAL